PLAFDPSLKGHTGELARQVVGPAVIDALDLFEIALPLEAQEVPAMRATVDERIDLARSIAGYDHRGLADRRGDIVARPGDLGRQTQKAPGRALEDPLLLQPVLLGIGVEPERDLEQYRS